MTEKWGEIQGKWDLVQVSGGVRVIQIRVTGFYCRLKILQLLLDKRSYHVLTNFAILLSFYMPPLTEIKLLRRNTRSLSLQIKEKNLANLARIQ